MRRQTELDRLIRSVAAAGERLSGAERRRFLRRGLVFLGAAGAGAAGAAGGPGAPPAVPPWTRSLGRGVVDPPYGVPSPHEAQVQRRTVDWLTPDRVAAVSFTPLADLRGIITPSGLCFERYHAGRPAVDPQRHRLLIHGLVERPLLLTMDDLLRLPAESVIRFLECPANGGMEWRGAQMDRLQFTHGMLACCEWTGVRLSTLLEECGVQPGAAWILAEGADGAHMSRSIPIDKAWDDALLVYGQNGEMLRPEQGYPLRLVNPGWEGNTWVKWLRRLEVGDRPWYQREETARYTDLLPDGRAREFSFVQEANSVITFPCPEKPVPRPGRLWVEGLAWSGRGRVRHVDVSFDGGVNWRPARFTSIVEPRALTRFGIEWEWRGEPALLQSRASDETGYVQPTAGQLRAARGSASIYHRNAIHTWELNADGSVRNVQLS